MNNKKTNWNENEFRIYLLLYAAYCDMKLSEEEKSLIISKSLEDEYQIASKQFEEDNDYERVKTILSFREKYYPSMKDIDSLLKEVAALLGCNDIVTMQERYFFKRLKQLLQG
ncbi:MAG: hypothetical protein R6V49_11345 [Bacteroidales bacterium]